MPGSGWRSTMAMALSKHDSGMFAHALLAGGMAVFACTYMLISCGSDAVAVRPTTISAARVAPARTPMRAGTPVLAPTIAASAPSNPTAHGRDNAMANLQTCILRHWIHSHEEDTQDVRVYRP